MRSFIIQYTWPRTFIIWFFSSLCVSSRKYVWFELQKKGTTITGPQKFNDFKRSASCTEERLRNFPNFQPAHLRKLSAYRNDLRGRLMYKSKDKIIMLHLMDVSYCISLACCAKKCGWKMENAWIFLKNALASAFRIGKAMPNPRHVHWQMKWCCIYLIWETAHSNIGVAAVL